MEVKRKRHAGKAFQHLAAQCRYLGGVRHAGGIAQRDAFHPQRQLLLNKSEHARLRYLPFKRAAKGGGERGIDEDTATAHRLNNGGKLCQRLLRRHAQVCAAVGVAGRHYQIDLIHAAGQRPLGTF